MINAYSIRLQTIDRDIAGMLALLRAKLAERAYIVNQYSALHIDTGVETTKPELADLLSGRELPATTTTAVSLTQKLHRHNLARNDLPREVSASMEAQSYMKSFSTTSEIQEGMVIA